MAKRIVVIGSLNMDIVVSAARYPLIGETINGHGVHYLSGGKGANQAVAIQKLGGNVKMIGAIGDDVFGHKLQDQLANYSLNTEQVMIKENTPTGIANIVHLPKDNSIIVVPGANGQLSPGDIEGLEEVIAEVDILLLQLEIPIETVDASLTIAKKHGLTTVLNPAPAIKLSKSLLEKVDYITPNETELQTLLDIGECQQFAQALQLWKNSYSSKLIVTLGDKGCAYLNNEEVTIIPAEKLGEVKDTTGAGDAFNAALVYGLAEEWDLSKILSFAVKVAGLAVTKFGAQEGMPYYDEVKQYIK